MTIVRITEKFEEAKYSRHSLGSADAQLILQEYNGFLKSLFRNYSLAALVFKYGAAVTQKTPLLIRGPGNN